MMEDAVIVAELDVVGVHGTPVALGAEDVARLEHLRDEDRALALGSRREEVEVLPDRAAHGARDADEVFESRPAASDRLEDQVAHDRAALDAQPAIRVPLGVRSLVPDDEAAESAIADEDVRAEPEHEVRHPVGARGHHRRGEVLRGLGLEEEVGGAADAERGERREGFVPPKAAGVQSRDEPGHFLRPRSGGAEATGFTATAGVARRASTRCTSESEPPAARRATRAW